MLKKKIGMNIPKMKKRSILFFMHIFIMEKQMIF